MPGQTQRSAEETASVSATALSEVTPDSSTHAPTTKPSADGYSSAEDEALFRYEDFPVLGPAQRHDSVVAALESDANTAIAAKAAIIPKKRLDSVQTTESGSNSNDSDCRITSGGAFRNAHSELTAPGSTWAKVAQVGKGTAVWEGGVRKAYPR